MNTQRKNRGEMMLLRIVLSLALLLIGAVLRPQAALASGGPQRIETVELTVGATYGDPVADTSSTISVAHDAPYFVTRVSVYDNEWNDVTSGNYTNGSIYRIDIDLAATGSYYFNGAQMYGPYFNYTGNLLVNGSDIYSATWSGRTPESTSMTVHYILAADYIDNVNVTISNIGVGESVSSAAGHISVPSDASYEVGEIVVCEVGADRNEEPIDNGAFKDKTAYHLIISLNAKSGRIFTTNAMNYLGSATINNSALSKEDTSAEGNQTTINLHYRFLLGLSYIESVSLTIEEPKAGNLPQKEATTSCLPAGSVTGETAVDLVWYKSDVEITNPKCEYTLDGLIYPELTKLSENERFSDDQCYYVNYKLGWSDLTAADGYVLDLPKNTKVLVNGSDASDTYANSLISFCHTWSKPVYTWSDDGKSCIAEAHCTTEGCEGKLREEAVVTSAVKTPAAVGKKGTTTYTATFKNAAFTTQTKDVEDIPALASDPGSKTATPAGKGTTLKTDDAAGIYVVTSDDEKAPTVSFKCAKKIKEKNITVRDFVEVDGVTYKVTSLAKNAFKNNKTVENVALGDEITAIGDFAFAGCTKLKSIKAGTGLLSIGKYAFKGTKNLRTLTLKSKNLTVKGLAKTSFSKIGSKVKIKVDKSKVKAYGKLFKKKGLPKKMKVKKL